MTRIGYVYRSQTHIADQADDYDFSVLRKHYDVILIHVNPKNIVNTLVAFVIKTPKCDVLYVWFAGFQAMLAAIFARLFHKKMVLLVGGYDTVENRQIGYGAFLTWYRSAMAHFSYRNATLTLACAKYTLTSLLKHDKPKKTVLLYTAVDTDRWFCSTPKERIVLTVGYIDKANVVRKGLRTFACSSKYFDDVQFILVGRDKDGSAYELKRVSENKLLIAGYVTNEELLKLYSRATVYCQLSMEEGFCQGLAHGMSCECVPVIANCAGLPETAGDTGYYVPYGDVESTVEAVKQALVHPELGKKARQRIVANFSSKIRERKLVSILDEMQK